MKETRLTSTRRISMKYCLLLFLIFSASISNALAQTTITGVVADEQKESLPGVSVTIKGSKTGTVTDFDGNYSINAKPGDVLIFSYLGMKNQSITVGSQSKIDAILISDSKMLTETVVIGYGSAKAKDLTSPIAVVNTEALNKHLAASPMQALQGQLSGVQVISSGQPGSSPKVNIRGVGNMETGYQGPLYVVDGMMFDNIDFLSSNDIENISVLKDASSAAIYGVRAANGVVLVTTKKGVPNRKPQITYDGYVGFQKASNVLKMANSQQYATFMRELNDPKVDAILDKSIAQWGGSNGIPATSTDWYKELLKTALMQSHALTVTGGSKDISYSLGASYLGQEGIMNVANNGYERVNVRARIDANATDWLKVGASFVMTNSNKQESGSNSWLAAYHNPSIYPAYNEKDINKLNPQGFTSAGEAGLSNFFWNPMGIAYYGQNKFEAMTQVLPSFYAEGTFLNDKLTLKSAFSQDLSMLRFKEYIPEYWVDGNQKRDKSYLQKRNEFTNNWILDNTATYRDNIGKHNFSAMLGNSIRRERNELLRVEATGVPGDIQEYWYAHLGEQQLQILKKNDDSHWADRAAEYRGLSYFGRLMYNYDDKYLVSATMRADGSSKYQEKWGYFPSIGLGWVLTQENFMKDQHLLNFLKLRANWGKLGNDKVQANDGFASISLSQAAINDKVTPGNTYVSYFSRLRWEVVEEYDLGIDFTLLNNRLSGTVDYFNRKTNDAVFRKLLPFGAPALLINGGAVQNKGVEMAFNWNDEIGKDFKYNAGINMTFLKNKVTNLNGLPSMELSDQQAHILGQPMGSFYGYKISGVYQNQAEVDADPIGVTSNLKPGDFKYQDTDGDGLLTAADRVILGSPIPTFTLGGNLGFEYKNIDFNLSYQGQFNHQIYNMKRTARKYQPALNMDEAWYNNRWTGEGSTNSYPSALGSVKDWNIGKTNSFFVEDADYFTIQNIQVGYTFNNIVKSNIGSKLRLSLTAERPFNFFSYNGFTTNIADGLDSNVYPLASSFSFGVKFIY